MKLTQPHPHAPVPAVLGPRRVAETMRRVVRPLVLPVLCALLVTGAGPARAQGVLLPPGEVLRPAGSIPGAAQPTQYQMFAPQTALPLLSTTPAAPATPVAPPNAQAVNPASANPPPPSVAAAPPPLPVPRPASANEAPSQVAAAPAAAAPTQIAPTASASNAASARVNGAGKPGAPFQPRAVAPVQGDQDRAPDVIIDKVSNYWNGVQVLSGNFVQVDPDGSRKTGDFYMQKPGRVRFEYDSPATLELISNGQSVAVRDRRLNTQDITPLSQTPLRFLLAQTIDLARDPHVVGVYQDNLYVTVVMEEKVPMLGTYKLLLLFDAKDYQLKQWIVTDPQGYDTSVAIRNLDYTRRPDPKLFVINFERMLQ